MKASAQWSPTGDGFVNPSGLGPGLDSAKDKGLVQEFLFGRAKRRPPAELPMLDPRRLFAAAPRPESGLRVTWLGHSTVLIEIDGYRVLTDPVWGPRSSPVSFAGPSRFHAPPLALDDLPALDAVVISHDHYDHLDYPTIKELAKREVPFVTSLGVGAHLEGWGIPVSRIQELDWWETAIVPGTGLRFTAAPSQHFSGRSLFDRNQTLWSSFAISAHRHQVFFSGDTGLTDEYSLIRERLGRFDLTMIEIGAWHPAWGNIHLGPENALRAHALLGGGALLPLHWGTFDLAVHPWDEPAETLVAAADRLSREEVTLVMPRLGGSLEPSQAASRPVDTWWREVSLTTPSSHPDEVEAPLHWAP
jgi:L-ascorbate metabolism protein UlaG (beta-lactamase superfamily)